MKPWAVLALLCFVGASAQERPAGGSLGVIREMPLNERTTYDIGINQYVPTTVLFPGPLNGFEGVGFSTKINEAAPVFIQHSADTNYFSVRALLPEASANLNVIHAGKLYTFHFFLSATPVRTLTLFDPAAVKAKKLAMPGKITPQRLIALLDEAKSYFVVAESYPGLSRGVEVTAPGTVHPFTRHDIIIDQAFRFDADDTIVLRVVFQNRTAEALYYSPADISIRIGSHLFALSIADVSGIIPGATLGPEGSLKPAQTFGYLAITGNPDGSRANVSLKNSFMVLMPVSTTPQQWTNRQTARR